MSCSSAAHSICALIDHDLNPDSLAIQNPSVARLTELLKELHHYIVAELTPPGRNEKWRLAKIKAAMNVNSVKTKLDDYNTELNNQMQQVLLAVTVSTHAAVQRILEETRRRDEYILKEVLREVVHDALEAFKNAPAAIRAITESSTIATPDYIVNRIADVVVKAKSQESQILEDVALGNITLDDNDSIQITTSVRRIMDEAKGASKRLKRPINIKDWMISAEEVSFSENEECFLGRGASGNVYLGEMYRRGKVAVKVFDTIGATSLQVETRIAKEIEAWRLISDHPNVVSLFGVSTKLNCYIVSEYCSYQDARKYLGQLHFQHPDDDEWPAALVQILSDTAKALQYVHEKGLVHRDVKGANIFIREDGSAALGDFGLSRIVGNISTTSASYQRGTPNWSSPEQLTTSSRTLTSKTDTWSFGMTILELLQDEEPFADSADVLKAVTADNLVIPAPVDVLAKLEFLITLVMDCCKKFPVDRISDDAILERLSSGMPLRKLFNELPNLVELLDNESDALLLRRVLELVVLQRDPLTPASMAALLGAQNDKINGVLDALQPALATDDLGRLQLKDIRLAEYLTDPRRCTDARFAIETMTANLRIAAFCLEVLSRELRANMCGFHNATEASRRMADMSPSERAELRGRIPSHVVYAARFWVDHVCDVGSETASAVVLHADWPNVRQRIESLATTAMVFWIEVLAAVDALDTLRTAVAKLLLLLTDSKKALALFTEAATLYDRFPELGSDSPACVYITVMPRLPQDSAVRRLLGDYAVLPFPIFVAQSPAFKSVTLLRTMGGRSGAVWSVAFSSDGCTLATGSEDNTIKLWEVSTGVLLRTLKGHSNVVTTVAFSSDGGSVVSGSDDSTIKLWEVATGGLLRTLKGHSKWVNSVVFSSDSRTVASGSKDRTIKLWEAEAGRLLRTLVGHSGLVASVAFSSDGRTLVSGSADQTIKLWEAATGQLRRTLVGHSGTVYSVVFSSNDHTLASGSKDKTIKLWEAEAGRLRRTLEGHAHSVRSVAFSNDGRTLVSGSADKTIKLWEVATGQVKTLQGHSNSVESVAFSSDGHTVASGSLDTTIKLWRTAS